MSLKKLKSSLDQKTNTLKQEENRQKQAQDSLKKEKSEWKDVSVKKQQELEASLQKKITSFTDKEADYT